MLLCSFGCCPAGKQDDWFSHTCKRDWFKSLFLTLLMTQPLPFSSSRAPVPGGHVGRTQDRLPAPIPAWPGQWLPQGPGCKVGRGCGHPSSTGGHRSSASVSRNPWKFHRISTVFPALAVSLSLSLSVYYKTVTI